MSSHATAAGYTVTRIGARPRRQSLVVWALALIFSPAAAFVLAYYGYYSFATFVNAVMPEGSLGGILIRAGTSAVVVIAWLRLAGSRDSAGGLALLPITLFFVAYGLRLIENVAFSDVYIPPGPDKIFLFYFLSSIIPGYLLALTCWRIEDRSLYLLVGCVCLIFVAGLALNISTLEETAEQRMMLEKINPIALGQTAVAFVLYYVLVFGRSKRLTIEACLLIPVLLYVAVYARSRGAYLAGAGAVVVYLLLLTGSRRVWAVLGLVLAALIGAVTVGGEYVDVIWARLAQTEIFTDSSTYSRYISFQGAWHQFMKDFAFGRYAIELNTGWYPHNIYLEALMSVGLVGSIPFFAHLALALRASVGIIRARTYPLAAVLCAVLFYKELISCAASNSIWGSSGFWITSMMVIAFWFGRPYVRGARRGSPSVPMPPLDHGVRVPGRGSAARPRMRSLPYLAPDSPN